MRIALIGTYPPQRCGIATFTADVESALQANGLDVVVVPIGTQHPQPSIDPDDPSSFSAAARWINEHDFDVALIQHEFGIYGGAAGSNILSLVDELALPFVVTLHTVRPQFDPMQRRVLEVMCARAAAVTVFTATGRRLLLDQNLVAPRAVQVVPHGAPPEVCTLTTDAGFARAKFGLTGRGPVLSTFGLLSPGKGIELAIEAVGLVRERHPNVTYVVAGRTHPEVERQRGEEYRARLLNVIEETHTAENIVLLDRFLSVAEIGTLMSATDVFLTPYRGEEQAVSGALTFALAAARPVVSTPYQYAMDVLSDGAGIIIPFGDVAAFAAGIDRLVSPGPERQAARHAASQAAAPLAWASVGRALAAVLAGARRAPTLVRSSRDRHERMRPTSSRHLAILCDDTALLQHADHRIPRIEEGYCVDDAGRAVPIVARRALAEPAERWDVVLARLLAFLRGAQDKGGMRNFMSWDRQWLDQPHRGDHIGRAVWGLGELVALEGPYANEARLLLARIVSDSPPPTTSRDVAYTMLGLAACVDTCGNSTSLFNALREQIAQWELIDDQWCWPEPKLHYDNARLGEVMVRVGMKTDDHDLVQRGVAALWWFERACLSGDRYRFPGHLGAASIQDFVSSGDEQPLEATAMLDAFEAVWQATGDPAALEVIDRAWNWFSGKNRLRVSVADPSTGAGFDALGTNGLNLNSGAESTLAYLRAADRVAEVRSLRRDTVSLLHAGHRSTRLDEVASRRRA